MIYKITNGSITYGANYILEQIDFEINEKDKIAIVGRNGSGKTTLLNSLIENDMLEEGIGEEKFSICREKNINIGYLKQINFQDSNCTMLEEILKVYDKVIKLEEKIYSLLNNLQINANNDLISKYTNSLEEFERLDGYTYKKEYETAIKKFGFSEEDKHRNIKDFSGGQRTKIAILKLLLSKPDILLLDEPTNYLDLNAIEWLENYLKNYPKAVVMVSHDRMFIDRVANVVYDIEYGKITRYNGNYTAYEKQKRENYEKQLKDFEYQQKEIKRLQNIADRFRYKPTKAKMALSKLKQIEHMDIVNKPDGYDLRTFYSKFPPENNSGKLVLSVRNLVIGYDKPLQTISFDLYKGRKLAIIGNNGIGKSTLLKTLNGEIEKLGGEFSYGYNVKSGYFAQIIDFDDPEATVYEDFSKSFLDYTETQIRTALATFSFLGDEVFKKIKVLSGGEKARLRICKVIKKAPNLLILDEPTNHMDIIGKESLENVLSKYKGTMLFVSHDRYFVNKIADSLLIFEPNKVTYLMEHMKNIQKENKRKNKVKQELYIV